MTAQRLCLCGGMHRHLACAVQPQRPSAPARRPSSLLAGLGRCCWGGSSWVPRSVAGADGVGGRAAQRPVPGGRGRRWAWRGIAPDFADPSSQAGRAWQANRPPVDDSVVHRPANRPHRAGSPSTGGLRGRRGACTSRVHSLVHRSVCPRFPWAMLCTRRGGPRQVPVSRGPALECRKKRQHHPPFPRPGPGSTAGTRCIHRLVHRPVGAGGAAQGSTGFRRPAGGCHQLSRSNSCQAGIA